jgi:oligopeptide transport system substrate-binding protein
MKLTRKLLVLLIILSLMLTFSACGGNVSSEELNMNVCIAGEPETIDPALNSVIDGAIMLNHMFEGLMKWENDGNGNAQITYGQAETYTVSDDGTVYTFTLRDDAKWSDGKAVTAHDFVYSWQRLIDPQTAAIYSYILEPVLNAVDIMYGEKDPGELGIKAIDEKTIEITLSTPITYFSEICAFPATFPVRQDMIEKNGDQWTFDVNTYIGNGPYKMNEWVHNSYLLMVPNENYYGTSEVGPSSIKFNFIEDSNAILAAYNNNELDFIQSIPINEIKTLLDSNQLKVADLLSTYALTFNNQKEPFNDVRVRKAFSLVIDRNYIVNQITQTGEVAASGFIPSGVLDAKGVGNDDFRTVGRDYYSIAEEDYESNCQQARQLLTEAGYPDGEGFPIVEYIYVTSSDNEAIAEALQNMWKTELGVTVTLSNQEGSVYGQFLMEGNYQIAAFSWLPDYNDPITFLDMWASDSGSNLAHYSNESYDSLITQIKSNQNQEERMNLMHDAEDLLISQDHVIAPVYFDTQTYMLNQEIKDMYYTPLGYFFFINCTY